MKKIILLTILILFFNGCYRLPQKEEIEYRNRLENALVETFPKKVVVVIHPFQNLSKKDTNRAYLETAIPDNLEAMLEPLRTTLAYIPFDGMPFYVSDNLSNLFQVVNVDDGEEANFDEFKDSDEDNEDDKDEDKDDDKDSIENNTDEKEDYDRYEDAYFSYLTNYLQIVPTQETQYVVNTTTNTNYFSYTTNTTFENGVEVTNIATNETLLTKTNSIDTNLVIVKKNLLTTTNMLLLLYEEFPTLTNYLSFLPIEVRRANETDINDFKDYQLKINNPKAWLAAQKKKKQEANKEISNQPSDQPEEVPFPTTEFEYTYHISGNFRTKATSSAIRPVQTSIQLQIYPPASSGDTWWDQKYKTSPPLLSEILAKLNSFDTNDQKLFKDAGLRTPFTKPKISPRLQDEFDTSSTNFRDYRPETPETYINKRKKPLSLRLNVTENEIPFAMMDWLKFFHANIINRPYTVLRVNSNPSKSLVYLNGFFIGSTPLIYPTAPIGSQRITFIKDGYTREELLTDIIAGKTNSISHSLTTLNNTGSMSITASIPDAEVYINSQYKGKVPLQLSNLSLNTKYRIEILNPKANLSSNRNSVYKQVILTEQKPSIIFDAKFKSYETAYKTPAQKGLLAATYISWFTTFGLLGASIYAQARVKETEDLIYQMGSPSTPAQVATLQRYQQDKQSFLILNQATLYSSVAVAIISSGLMGWYLYSKEIYLGMGIDPEKQEWYANFKLKF